MSAQAMLRKITGLTVSKSASDRAIRQRMEITGQVNREHYLDTMTQEELTELVELVVVPESWLFRDPQAFYVAADFVKARMAEHAGARAVRILSVPCAGGEEPYSMVMALRDAGVPMTCFTIDAYDLSTGCLARARSGVYGRNAFRTQELTFRDRYFTAIGNDDYRIDDAIRTKVRFHQGNLLELDAGGRAFDLVFCRNLLIYFDKPTTVAAIERLSSLLAHDGLLFAGYAEVPSFAQHGFTPLPHRHAFALRKDCAPGDAPPPAPRAASAGSGLPPMRGDGGPPARAEAQPFGAGRRAAPRPPPAARGGQPGSAGTPLPARSGQPAERPAHRPAGATAPAANTAELLSHARKLADRGDNEPAAAACQAVLAAAPETAEAYFLLGMLSEHASKAAQAEEHWRRCIYLQPDHYEALCHLALLAEQSGDSSGAAALKARAKRIYQRQQRGTERVES